MKKVFLFLLLSATLAIKTQAQTWEAITLPTTFTNCILPVEPGHIYAKNDKLIMIQDGSNRLYMSLDRGKNWKELKYPGSMPSAIYEYQGKLFFSSFSGVFTSVDNGTTWVKTNAPLTSVSQFLEYNQNLYAASDSKGLLKWDATAQKWNTVAFGATEVGWIGQAQGLLFAKNDGLLRFSKDNAITWTATNSSGGQLTGIASAGNFMMISGYFSNFSTSTDKGANWTITNTESHYVVNVDNDIIGAHAKSSTDGNGIYKYDIAKSEWADYTQGVSSLKRTYALAYNQNGYLYALCDVATQPGDMKLRLYGLTVGKISGTNLATLPESEIAIFPNPTSNIINIQIQKATPLSYEISDLQGKIIQKENINTNNTQISTNHLAKGLYLLKVNCEEGSRIEKVSIQ